MSNHSTNLKAGALLLALGAAVSIQTFAQLGDDGVLRCVRDIRPGIAVAP